MKRFLVLAATLLLVAAACGDDDDSGDDGGGVTIESDADGIITDTDDTDDTDGDASDTDDGYGYGANGTDETGFDGAALLDIDLDEQSEVTGEIFDGKSSGNGTGTQMGRSYFMANVDPADFTEAELVAGCEAMTDFVFDLPEDRAAGPVDIFVTESFQVGGEDDEHLVANETLIPREERGSCEVQ